MYRNKLAAAIMVDGQVLREVDDAVYIPYGAEYAITLKNLNNVRALVHIEIDGVNVAGGGFVLHPNQTLPVERFIENGNLQHGLKFKLIERTQKIEDGPRGIKLEDGIVRIRFAFDVSASKLYRSFQDYDESCGTPMRTLSRRIGASYETNTMNTSFIVGKSGTLNASAAQTENGITVGGSVSNQTFVSVDSFPTGEESIMVFRLLGDLGQYQVIEPMTVKTKVECPTCGTSNKFGAKFCPECGAGLVKV